MPSFILHCRQRNTSNPKCLGIFSILKVYFCVVVVNTAVARQANHATSRAHFVCTSVHGVSVSSGLIFDVYINTTMQAKFAPWPELSARDKPKRNKSFRDDRQNLPQQFGCSFTVWHREISSQQDCYIHCRTCLLPLVVKLPTAAEHGWHILDGK